MRWSPRVLSKSWQWYAGCHTRCPRGSAWPRIAARKTDFAPRWRESVHCILNLDIHMLYDILVYVTKGSGLDCFMFWRKCIKWSPISSHAHSVKIHRVYVICRYNIFVCTWQLCSRVSNEGKARTTIRVCTALNIYQDYRTTPNVPPLGKIKDSAVMTVDWANSAWFDGRRYTAARAGGEPHASGWLAHEGKSGKYFGGWLEHFFLCVVKKGVNAKLQPKYFAMYRLFCWAI